MLKIFGIRFMMKVSVARSSNPILSRLFSLSFYWFGQEILYFVKLNCVLKILICYRFMRKLSVFLSLLIPCVGFAQDLPDWENPSVISRNTERPHTTIIPYADETSAAKIDRAASPYFKSLNGTWKLSGCRTLPKCPVIFFRSIPIYPVGIICPYLPIGRL